MSKRSPASGAGLLVAGLVVGTALAPSAHANVVGHRAGGNRWRIRSTWRTSAQGGKLPFVGGPAANARWWPRGAGPLFGGKSSEERATCPRDSSSRTTTPTPDRRKTSRAKDG